MNGGAYGSCTNGSIVARSISVEGNNYTSQLNVTVTLDTAGITILCYYSRIDPAEESYDYLEVVIPTTGLS